MAILLSLSLAAMAAELTIPNRFSNGEPADADEVNANFDAVKDAVDDNYQKIVTFSEPRSASVTYSAMGFTVDKSQASGLSHATEFEKSWQLGLLVAREDDGGYFFHSVTLPSGVNITQIRAHLYDGDNEGEVSAVVKLRKKEYNNQTIPDVATLTWNGLGVTETGEDFAAEKLENPEYIEWLSSGYPSSYFIEVNLGSSSVGLYSVTIDYEYAEP
jgi:hypothetical protein